MMATNLKFLCNVEALHEGCLDYLKMWMWHSQEFSRFKQLDFKDISEKKEKDVQIYETKVF